MVTDLPSCLWPKISQPDNGFDGVALHFGRHVPGQWQVTVEDVVSSTSIVVSNGVALGAVADRFLAVVTNAALREARNCGRLLRRTTTLHRKRNISTILSRVSYEH